MDYGEKRIGLAIGDPESDIVSPAGMIPAGRDVGSSARAILDAVDEYGAAAVVIGLPLNMDGSKGPQAKLSQELAVAVRKAANEAELAIDVHLHDERLTSMEADERIVGRELTRRQRKDRRDALAAQVILQSWFNTRNESE